MGLCGSKENLTEAQKKELEAMKERNKQIDQQQQAAKDNQRGVVKLLILGAGESGKSTLLKQMTLLYVGNFSQETCGKYKKDIHNNIVESIKTLVRMSDQPGKLNLTEEKEDSKVRDLNLKSKDYILALPDDEPVEINEEIAAHIKSLWTDEGIQVTYDHRSRFQLPDSAAYYFLRIEEIGKAAYVPSQDDVLRSRVRTTGVIQTNFNMNGNRFEVYDVGGQRSERKKWIHCFEGVTAVIFVAAISEYDQTVYEDNKTNRVHEALELFDKICNSEYFKQTSMILFLNKFDLFEKKIGKVPITQCFPEYKGAMDRDSCANYIRGQFKAKNRNVGENAKEIYTHYTSATDTEQMRHVLEAVQDIILKASLRSGGLM